MALKTEPQALVTDCFTCQRHSEECLPIFTGSNGDTSSSHIAELLVRHFWFIQQGDVHPEHVICGTCWDRLSEFHRFYLEVEQVHGTLKHRKRLEVVEGDVDDKAGEKSERLDRIQVEELVLKEEEDVEMSCADFESDLETISNENTAMIEPKWGFKCKMGREVAKEDDDKAGEGSGGLDEIQVEELILKEENETEASCKKYESGLVTNPHESPRIKSENLPIVEPKPKGKKRSKYMTIQSSADVLIQTHRKYTCDICEKDCGSFSKLVQHMPANHEGHKACISCCGRRYFNKHNLLYHVRQVMNPNIDNENIDNETFKCSQCGKVCSSRTALSEHIYYRHSSGQKTCNICGLNFPSVVDLKRHKETHKPAQQCEICKKWVKYIRFHKHTDHVGWVMCNICNEWCSNSNALSFHQATEHTKDRPFLNCPHCEKKFRVRAFLNKHLNSAHNRYPCDSCGIQFLQEKDWITHQKWKHDVAVEVTTRELRPKQGTETKNQNTPNEASTNKHLNGMDRQYPCDSCEIQYLRKRDWVAHQKWKHPGMRYDC